MLCSPLKTSNKMGLFCENACSRMSTLGQIYSALGEKVEGLNKFTTARGILAPLAQTSSNKVWLDYVQSIDEDIAALK
jgi:hypothetical protein